MFTSNPFAELSAFIMKLDDDSWHCFTVSRYDRASNSWDLEKAPVYHIVD